MHDLVSDIVSQTLPKRVERRKMRIEAHTARKWKIGSEKNMLIRCDMAKRIDRSVIGGQGKVIIYSGEHLANFGRPTFGAGIDDRKTRH